ncbi:hypothetical protein [Alkalihalobacillus trypoxylicola]|uniref:Uncharacterized protein n=1 Tax=Alkalihalobacillus trypoxylicola TaxID=519424 RepID=A0A161Q1Q4_9BACI|nr:hypothetical protein [Alkalihalobacillus trypoxylicola]KYG34901.1 hypothetical protein AZF04_00790 [Alkalihalobacillus trypoxylicola]
MSDIDKKLHDLENQVHAVRLEVDRLKQELDAKDEVINKHTIKTHNRINAIEERIKAFELLLEQLKRESSDTNNKVDSVQKIVEEDKDNHQKIINMQKDNQIQIVEIMKENQTYLKEQNKDLMKKILWIVGIGVLLVGAFFGLDLNL